MVRLLASAFLASIILMVWGFLVWGVSPLMFYVFKPLPGGGQLAQTLKADLPESGIYLYPLPDHGTTPADRASAEERWQAQQREGPIVQLFFLKGGVEPMAPTIFLQGFLHFLASALLAGVLLKLALPGLPSYGARVLFVFLAGLFAGVAIDLSDPIWFHHPWNYHLARLGYHASEWLLAGSVMALIIRPVQRA